MKKILSILMLIMISFGFSCTKKEEKVQEFDKSKETFIILPGESENLGIGGEPEKLEQILDSQASADTQSQDFSRVSTEHFSTGKTFE